LTALRQAEKNQKQLAESRENFRRAQKIGQLGSFIVDFRRNLVSWSEGTNELLGLSAAKPLTYQQFLDLVHPDDREAVSSAWRNLPKEQAREGEFRVIVNESTKSVRVSVESVVDAKGESTTFIGIMQDVTALRNATAHTEFLRENLIRLSRITTVEALSSKIVHEINQPLTAQRTNTETALQLLSAQPSDISQLRLVLIDILEDSRRIQTIVQGIRHLIKKKAPTYSVIDLPKLISDTVRLVKTSPVFARIGTQMNMPVQPLEISGDGVQLQQIFINLLNNAYEACVRSNTFPSCVTVTTKGEENFVLITISDTGTGIDRQQADLMFEPFCTTKEEGIGMGLAISRMIVEAHNGKVGYHNNLDRGATFWVRLPNYSPRFPELSRDATASRPLSLRN
jgi:two-component system sensor kinase FixL